MLVRLKSYITSMSDNRGNISIFELIGNLDELKCSEFIADGKKKGVEVCCDMVKKATNYMKRIVVIIPNHGTKEMPKRIIWKMCRSRELQYPNQHHQYHDIVSQVDSQMFQSNCQIVFDRFFGNS